MTANEARTHLRYSGWASRKLMDAAKSLNPDDLTRSTGVSHGSIEGTLSHIHFADRIWYSRVVDMNEPVIKQASFAELEQQWPAIQQKWEAWADSLQDADLDRVLSYSMTDGTARQSVLSHILMHVVNHATLHRGQAVGMIRQLGIKPPTTDLMAYYRETAAEAGAAIAPAVSCASSALSPWAVRDAARSGAASASRWMRTPLGTARASSVEPHE